jgi:hypothetical protein
MELFAGNPDAAFDPMIPGGDTLLTVPYHDNFFLSMDITFSSNYFAVPALITSRKAHPARRADA